MKIIDQWLSSVGRANLIGAACHRNQLTVKVEQKFSLTTNKVRMELSRKILKREVFKGFVLEFLERLHQPR